jgi:DNA (cytosine-5)-methyltransferase 1
MEKRRRRKHIRLGSLCTGYGGLDMAVMKVLGAQLAWVADNDRHVRTLLAARHPHLPNLGDLNQLDWRQVDPVDVLCAGFPCQDVSFAGRGAGIAHCVGDA